jgi:hypothetical protein
MIRLEDVPHLIRNALAESVANGTHPQQKLDVLMGEIEAQIGRVKDVGPSPLSAAADPVGGRGFPEPPAGIVVDSDPAHVLVHAGKPAPSAKPRTTAKPKAPAKRKK